MLWFLTQPTVRYTVRDYVRGLGAPMADRISVRGYGGRAARFHPGTYIFTDLEPLSSATRRDAARLYRRLSRRGMPCLNDPDLVLRRYDLLRTLREQGWNRFNVYRPDEIGTERPRYPVFLRGEHDHGGPHGDLIEDEASLRRALGRHPGSPLIVEFLDTSDAAGVFRKYAAFRVGEHVIPRHLFFSSNWMVKSADLSGPSRVEEELRYVTDHPHTESLDTIFRIAGVEWGRVDYALHEGSIQVWEINTNPAIVSRMSFETAERRPVHEHFATRLNARLADLDAAGPPPGARPVWNPNRRWAMPWTW